MRTRISIIGLLLLSVASPGCRSPMTRCVCREHHDFIDLTMISADDAAEYQALTVRYGSRGVRDAEIIILRIGKESILHWTNPGWSHVETPPVSIRVDQATSESFWQTLADARAAELSNYGPVVRDGLLYIVTVSRADRVNRFHIAGGEPAGHVVGHAPEPYHAIFRQLREITAAVSNN